MQNQPLEFESGYVKLFNVGTVGTPLYAVTIGDTSTSPPTGGVGYATQGIALALDATGSTASVFVNIGTGTSCSFEAVT